MISRRLERSSRIYSITLYPRLTVSLEALERQLNNNSSQSSPLALNIVNSSFVDSRSPAIGEQASNSTASASETINPHSNTSSQSVSGSNWNAAVNDLISLPHSYFSILVDLWFKEDHPWLPILDHDHIQQSLTELQYPVEYIPDIVLRAVMALKIAYSSQAISLGYKGRERLSQHLRAGVLTEAMATPSLNSIRALFIIAMLDFGSDNIPSTFNIMSMCRRTGEHIGIFRQLLDRVEAQSPEHVGPPSRQGFLDNAQIAQTWAVVSFDAVSSLGVPWRDASASLVDHFSGIAFVSAPDFRDSFVTHVHLSAIGIQPVHEFFVAYANGQHSALEGATVTAAEDIYQNLRSYLQGLPTSGYTILADGAVDFDINHIFTRLLSNTAIIMLYQRYLSGSQNVALARERCMDAYFQMIDIIRNVSDADTEINSPTFAHFIGTTARFRLVLEQMTGDKREPLFDCLMHGVNMCGRRWPLARRIDISLRAALIEVDTGQDAGLPGNFWDLTKSGHEISEEMKRWVNSYKPSLWVGSLNGPYV